MTAPSQAILRLDLCSPFGGALALAFVLTTVGCSTSANVPGARPADNHEAPDSPAPVTTAPADPSEAGPSEAEPASDDGQASADEIRSPGEAPSTACNTKADCPTGHVCEGQGCGDLEGRCAPPDRMCTRDLRTYCSCDGETFRGSGSCPGRRYSREGPCDGTAPDPAP